MTDKTELTEIFQPIVIVSGPTASGKSSYAIELAKKINGEIVNIDSVQIYKGFEIGAAAVSKDEMMGVVHHLIGILEASIQCNVADYRKLALAKIKEIQARGKTAILVGGTSLYITHLLQGLAELPQSDLKLRAELELLSSEELMKRLQDCDSVSAEKFHVNDRLRVIRALETSLLLGAPASESRKIHSYTSKDSLVACIVVLCRQREDLYERINNRTTYMIERGLIEETQKLFAEYGKEMGALKSLGYAQAISYLENKISKEDLISEIAMHTRRFAKRQMTFWRNEPAKRGWKMRPQDNDSYKELTEEVSKKSSLKKSFKVLDWSRAEVVDYVQGFLKQNAGTEVLFLEA